MQNTSVQLQIFPEETLKELTLSHLDRLAKISALQAMEKDWEEKGVFLSSKQLDWLLKSDHLYLSGKMLKELSPATLAQTFGQLSKPLPTLGTKYGVYEKQVWINKKEGTFEIVEGVKEIPKTQRYKQLGNAVTVDIVEKIAKKLNYDERS